MILLYATHEKVAGCQVATMTTAMGGSSTILSVGMFLFVTDVSTFGFSAIFRVSIVESLGRSHGEGLLPVLCARPIERSGAMPPKRSRANPKPGKGSSGAGENSMDETGVVQEDGCLRVGKYVCPTIHVGAFTPMQFEEASCDRITCLTLGVLGKVKDIQAADMHTQVNCSRVLSCVRTAAARSDVDSDADTATL